MDVDVDVDVDVDDDDIMVIWWDVSRKQWFYGDFMEILWWLYIYILVMISIFEILDGVIYGNWYVMLIGKHVI